MKVKEIRDMSAGELNQKVASLKEELFNLRFQHATGQLENPMRIREVKKSIARIKTIQREQELKSDTVSAIKDEKYTAAGDYQRNLDYVRGQQKQLEALLRRAEEESKKPAAPEARASIAALDSLARIGGSFAGSDGGFRDLQRVNEKQVALLEKIDAKIGKGAGVF